MGNVCNSCWQWRDDACRHGSYGCVAYAAQDPELLPEEGKDAPRCDPSDADPSDADQQE